MMRTTLDLPDSLLRELKSRAAMNGQSLKALLHELIVRGSRQPFPETTESKPGAPPVLQRLQIAKLKEEASTSQPPVSNAELADLQLQDDIEKLRRSGFIR
jgi:hypothetical protein